MLEVSPAAELPSHCLIHTIIVLSLSERINNPVSSGSPSGIIILINIIIILINIIIIFCTPFLRTMMKSFFSLTRLFNFGRGEEDGVLSVCVLFSKE